MIKRIILIMVLVSVLVLGGLAVADRVKTESGDAQIPNPVVTIEMESGGIMKFVLYPEMAMNTVSNFVELAQSGYYDGLTFHRVVRGFVIQGGDPLGTGMGGPGWSIKGEFADNGYSKNTLKHTRGVISMARGGDPDSAGSQFFIMHLDASHLDGAYAAFGMMTEGFEVLDQIANTPGDANNKPLNMADCVIKSVTVDTFGFKYSTVKIDEK